MARKALIETATGLVANVIEIEDGANWQPPAGQSLIDAANANPGDTWDGTQFVPRQPTAEEVAQQIKVQKRQKAKERAIAAIKANQTGAPWGQILYDLAVAQGWIEE